MAIDPVELQSDRAAKELSSAASPSGWMLDLEFNESILSWADPEEGATEQNWTLFGAALAAIHDWSVERGVPVVAVIVPSKEEVYRAARLHRWPPPLR